VDELSTERFVNFFNNVLQLALLDLNWSSPQTWYLPLCKSTIDFYQFFTNVSSLKSFTTFRKCVSHSTSTWNN